MDEIATRENQEIATLNVLAREAKMYSEAAALNMLQLGRVLTEAKELVPHGGWMDWVRENAQMSESQAQSLMRAYKRFGETRGIEGIEKSKIFKMLSLPDGTEENFLTENNVRDMSARQVEEAVKKVRAEAEAQLKVANEARERAEKRVDQLENRPPEIPDSALATIRKKEAELIELRQENERLAQTAKDALESRHQLIDDKKGEMAEMEEMLTSQQQDIDRLQTELFAAQSALARGDAERDVNERLTAEEFTRAVRAFIGTVAQMPYMGNKFAVMTGEERDEFTEGLSAIADWVKGAEKALNTVEGVIVGE